MYYRKAYTCMCIYIYIWIYGYMDIEDDGNEAGDSATYVAIRASSAAPPHAHWRSAAAALAQRQSAAVRRPTHAEATADPTSTSGLGVEA